MLFYSLNLHKSTKGDLCVCHHSIVESCRQVDMTQVPIFLHSIGQFGSISPKGLIWGEMNASTTCLYSSLVHLLVVYSFVARCEFFGWRVEHWRVSSNDCSSSSRELVEFVQQWIFCREAGSSPNDALLVDRREERWQLSARVLWIWVG